MKVLFTEKGWNDYRHWAENDRSILERLNRLIEDARRSPFQGLGKPEALKQELAGWWSRRIIGEHRLIYRVTGAEPRIEIAACRTHYGK